MISNHVKESTNWRDHFIIYLLCNKIREFFIDTGIWRVNSFQPNDTYQNRVTVGSDNGLLPLRAKPFYKPMPILSLVKSHRAISDYKSLK